MGKGDPLEGTAELTVLHPGGLQDIVRDAQRKMHYYNASLWSLNVSDNPFYMKAGRLSCRNGLCNGFFWGCRIRKSTELELKYGDGHEDVERSLRHFRMDGVVLRYREFCAKTRCQTNAGGLQSSSGAKIRRMEEETSADLLVSEFPLLLQRTPGSKLGVKFT